MTDKAGSDLSPRLGNLRRDYVRYSDYDTWERNIGVQLLVIPRRRICFRGWLLRPSRLASELHEPRGKSMNGRSQVNTDALDPVSDINGSRRRRATGGWGRVMSWDTCLVNIVQGEMLSLIQSLNGRYCPIAHRGRQNHSVQPKRRGFGLFVGKQGWRGRGVARCGQVDLTGTKAKQCAWASPIR